MAAEIRHAIDLLCRSTRRSQPMQRLVIHVIHDDDPVETRKILLPDLTRTVREVIPPTGRRTPHPRIGKIAPVPAICPGGIHLHPLRKPGLLDSGAKNPLGGRRSANIAQTDKQNSCFHRRKDNASRLPQQIPKAKFRRKRLRYASLEKASRPDPQPTRCLIRPKKMTIRTIIESYKPPMFKEIIVTLPPIYSL